MRLSREHIKLLKRIKDERIKCNEVNEDLSYKERILLKDLKEDGTILESKNGSYWLIAWWLKYTTDKPHI